MFTMSCGGVAEVLGYVGRIMKLAESIGQGRCMHDTHFFQILSADHKKFLAQICCLTLAPAFFAAGIYLCLSRM
jgi:hypothetical protein